MGKLARNNVEWLYHNGARYWEAFKKGVHKYPVPILFTSFLFGEVAAATLFHSMYQRTTIPVLKEAFRCVGKDEARHIGICQTVLQKVVSTSLRRRQAHHHQADQGRLRVPLGRAVRAAQGFLGAAGHLPAGAAPLGAGRAREAGLGVLSHDERRENWRQAVLKMKGFVEPHGIVFPALPEIGIDGETVAFDSENLIPVF